MIAESELPCSLTCYFCAGSVLIVASFWSSVRCRSSNLEQHAAVVEKLIELNAELMERANWAALQQDRAREGGAGASGAGGEGGEAGPSGAQHQGAAGVGRGAALTSVGVVGAGIVAQGCGPAGPGPGHTPGGVAGANGPAGWTGGGAPQGSGARSPSLPRRLFLCCVSICCDERGDMRSLTVPFLSAFFPCCDGAGGNLVNLFAAFMASQEDDGGEQQQQRGGGGSSRAEDSLV